MSAIEEKKGLKGLVIWIIIAILGFFQSLFTEVAADGIVRLIGITGVSTDGWALFFRIGLLVVLALIFAWVMEMKTKGIVSISIVPYSIGGLSSLLLFEIITELFDGLLNEKIWESLEKGIDMLSILIIIVVVSILLFVALGAIIGYLTKEKERLVGIASRDMATKVNYYYKGIWLMLYLIAFAVIGIIFWILAKGLPVWVGYSYWG